MRKPTQLEQTLRVALADGSRGAGQAPIHQRVSSSKALHMPATTLNALVQNCRLHFRGRVVEGRQVGRKDSEAAVRDDRRVETRQRSPFLELKSSA